MIRFSGNKISQLTQGDLRAEEVAFDVIRHSEQEAELRGVVRMKKEDGEVVVSFFCRMELSGGQWYPVGNPGVDVTAAGEGRNFNNGAFAYKLARFLSAVLMQAQNRRS